MQKDTEKNGIKYPAKKALGQNFLVNPGIAPKMIRESGISSEFGVVEIGPGYGALTKELLYIAKKVVAVEIDGDLIPELRSAFSGFSNLTLLHDDVLKMNLARVIEEEFAGMPVAVIGNLPYYITSPIIMKILEDRLPIEMVVAMVQKEAAVRLAAEEGSRETGAVTLTVRYYSRPAILFSVSPGSFFPAPKVASAVIRLNVRKQPPVAPKSEEAMFRVIKSAFSQRRKTAVNAISSGLSLSKERVSAAFSRCGIDLMLRAERLTLFDYAALSDDLF